MIKAILAHLAGKARPEHAPPKPPGTACERVLLKRCAQRHRINRVYPDAVGSMPGQGIRWADGRARRESGSDEEGSTRR